MGVTAPDILKTMFNPNETVCLRVFSDKKDGVFKGQNLSVEAGKFSSIEETLKQHNALDRGIFYVVNFGGQSDEDITRINAQFVESDTLSFEEMQKRIDEFPLAPSMIIKTRKSLHTYWFIKDGDVSRFRGIQKALVKHFDGDPMCVNESRVMRLPGFNHCKEDPVMVECVSFHPERKYTQDQLAQHLPKVEPDKPKTALKGNEKGLDVVMCCCDFLKHCRDDAATLPEHDWYAMITNLAPFEGGVELIHELSAPYPKYDAADTTDKINHFLESGTRPMMCETICEKGFK